MMTMKINILLIKLYQATLHKQPPSAVDAFHVISGSEYAKISLKKRHANKIISFCCNSISHISSFSFMEGPTLDLELIFICAEARKASLIVNSCLLDPDIWYDPVKGSVKSYKTTPKAANVPIKIVQSICKYTLFKNKFAF